MKVGDLVTLSSYCLQTAPMWTWRERIWKQKKPLVGLIVKVNTQSSEHSHLHQRMRRHTIMFSG